MDRHVDSHAAEAGFQPVAVQETLEAFIRRERRGLMALAYALTGSRETAEDIVQEALLAASRNWDRVGSMDSPLGWVRRVVANRSTSATRRRIAASRGLARLALRQGSPAAQEEMPSDSAHVWALIRRLPRRQAQVITLRALYSLSLQEIGAELGISKESVQTHLARARAEVERGMRNGVRR